MKRYAPATARNSAPIAQVLAEELPARGTVLEIASETGEHAVFFARRFPHLGWQPSDSDSEAVESIAAWTTESGLPNLLPPLLIDAAGEWPINPVDAVLCINMVHISPWSATQGLFRGAERVLAPGGPLILYGPYLEEGVETAPSNLAFDAGLKERDPRWGLREIRAIDELSAQHGMQRAARYTMPANNIVLVYRRLSV